MAITRNETRDKVFEFLRDTIGMSVAGACGFEANLFSESGVRFNTVEGLLIQRLSEDGQKQWKRPVNTEPNITLNNELYTKLVDDGTITKEQFLSPRGKSYAYGLWQSTTRARKTALWNNTKGKGKSISDPQGQLETLKAELEGGYKSTLDYCKKATSAEDAAEYVLRHFEMPKITASVVSARRSYATQFYSLYKNYSSTSNKTTSNTNNLKEVTTVLNVRKHPSKAAALCTTFGPLDKGAKVSVVKNVEAQDGSVWCLVTYKSGQHPAWVGKSGYCSSKYLK